MRYLLDTNILIYLIKNRPAAVAAKVAQLNADDSLHMSFVTWAELLKGAESSNQAAAVRQRLDKLAQQVTVLYKTSHVMCEHHARLSAMLKQKGMPIGSNDLWIASHALAENSILVTNNEREFARIPGLEIQNWAG